MPRPYYSYRASISSSSRLAPTSLLIHDSISQPSSQDLPVSLPPYQSSLSLPLLSSIQQQYQHASSTTVRFEPSETAHVPAHDIISVTNASHDLLRHASPCVYPCTNNARQFHARITYSRIILRFDHVCIHVLASLIILVPLYP